VTQKAIPEPDSSCPPLGSPIEEWKEGHACGRKIRAEYTEGSAEETGVFSGSLKYGSRRVFC
jgi:hypothetical protein